MSKAKLLIPLDGSEFSREILPHVRNVTSPDTYQVILLRVTESPRRVVTVPGASTTSGTAFVAYPEQQQEEIRLDLLGEMSEDARALEAAGFSVSREVRFGDPASEIVNLVEQEGVSVVAMATHGRTGLSRLLVGSVAETVLRRLGVPILLLNPTEVDSREAEEASWEQIARDWGRYRDEAKRTWGKLTSAELDVVAGDREQLMGKVVAAYGMSPEDAAKEVENWRLGLYL